MHFLDDSLLPENQQKLVIQVAPYGPQWLPGDFPEDIPVSFAEQVQKAVDCYKAGATVLHVQCRDPVVRPLPNVERRDLGQRLETRCGRIRGARASRRPIRP